VHHIVISKGMEVMCSRKYWCNYISKTADWLIKDVSLSDPTEK